MMTVGEARTQALASERDKVLIEHVPKIALSLDQLVFQLKLLNSNKGEK